MGELFLVVFHRGGYATNWAIPSSLIKFDFKSNKYSDVRSPEYSSPAYGSSLNLSKFTNNSTNSICKGIFHRLCPLGRVGHRVAMSVCVCVCMCVTKVVIVDNGQTVRVFVFFLK